MQEYMSVGESTVAEFIKNIESIDINDGRALAAETIESSVVKTIESPKKEMSIAKKGIYSKEEIISVEPGVKYLVDIEKESNWFKFTSSIKRIWWKATHKDKGTL